MAQLFGFQITRTSKDKGEQPSFVLPDPEDERLPLLVFIVNL